MANPDRSDYDPDKFSYDEDSDTLYSYDECGTDYDGDGNPINNSDD